MDHAAPNGDRIADPTRGALAQRYAEGILRFFRARLALAQSRNDDACALAWSYLQAVDPEQVPPDARPAFCDLTRLMYWQTMPDSGSRDIWDNTAAATMTWDTDCNGTPCDPVGAGLLLADQAISAVP